MKRTATDTYVRAGWSTPLIQHALKRSLDVCLTVVALAWATPLLLLVAAAVALTSRGPILFPQRRVGGRMRIRNGEVEWEPFVFTMYKFRSMVVDAPESRHKTYVEAFIRGDDAAMRAHNPGGAMFKLEHDPRLTPIGALLRRTSLDELPQLWNVLWGDMTLVGPRPALEYEVQQYGESHMRRFDALSGITGWWQVVGRSRVSFEEMVRLDVWYIRNRSLALDVKILFMTVGALFRSEGAA